METKLNSFQQVMEVFNLQLQFLEKIEEGKLSVPRNKKELTMEVAHWCLSKLKVFNKGNPVVKEVEAICLNYLEIRAQIGLEKLLKEAEI